MEIKEEIENEENNSINNINKPEFYLLITGEAGKNNYGVLVRSASAFDCKEIFILGVNKKITKKFFGSHGTAKKMKYRFFSSVAELNLHCTNNKIQIYGVNINYKNNEKISAVPIHEVDFENQKTLFVLGNTMYPIKPELEKIMTKFTYVDQGEKGENIFELNLAVVGSIAMHYFGVKNDYKMAGLNNLYNDEKYIVTKKINHKCGNKSDEQNQIK